MSSADSEEEEVGLVRRRGPGLLGLQFKDEADHRQVQRLSLASLGIAVFSFLLFGLHLHHKGSMHHVVGHLAFSLALPAVGFVGVQFGAHRLVWLFHLGTVLFAIAHLAWGIKMLDGIAQTESDKPEDLCQSLKGFLPNPAAPLGDGLVTTLPPWADPYRQCVDDARAKQEHAPWRIFWWTVMTTPLWLLMLYSAYHSHEYYIRVRVHEVVTHAARRRRERGGGYYDGVPFAAHGAGQGATDDE